MTTRYNRQELFEEIGREGQQKIQSAGVAVVGLGAVGSVSAELLCRAGIGKLILIDRDFVEQTNLQRQTLYEEVDVGKAKARAAEEHLHRINSKVPLSAHIADLTFKNISTLLHQADIIVDGTDNLETRFLMDEYCLQNNKSWVYGAAVQDRGFVMSFSGKGACFQCLMKEKIAEGTCDTLGVLNTITTLVGSLQAQECLNSILGKQVGRLLHVKLMTPRFDVLEVAKDPSCPACHGQYEYLDGRKGNTTIRFCATGQFQISPQHQLDLPAVKRALERAGKVEDLGFCLVFRNMKVFRERVLIRAKTEEEARAIYARYIGR